jgi:hypothetical protein
VVEINFLWLHEPTRKIVVTLRSIRTFLEMEYAIAIVEEVKLHDTIALSELALTYLHGFALGELATTLYRDKN